MESGEVNKVQIKYNDGCLIEVLTVLERSRQVGECPRMHHNAKTRQLPPIPPPRASPLRRSHTTANPGIKTVSSFLLVSTVDFL